MTVHMIRIAAHHPDGVSVGQVQTEVDEWLTQHTEWVGDSVAHEITTAETEDTGLGYLVGDFRFEYSDVKANLLDTIEQRLQQIVEWYRLRYHACDHDESSRGGCGWDDLREFGTVPADV